MKIYISGLYSGPNPSAGLGIARALRAAYPDAELVGVDYSSRSSGLHWPDFDRIWLQRPWREIDLDTYQDQIATLLDAGAFWISGLDIEALWLAHCLHPNDRLLVPPVDAFARTAKPSIEAHSSLPVDVPTFLSTADRSDWDIYAFCRRHAWRIWVKGPYYDAIRGSNWPHVSGAVRHLSETWGTGNLFVQVHVSGYEESIALSAYQGELLDCIYMRKRETTAEGKTWAGAVSEVPEGLLEPLRNIVADLAWTGGAELEMLRDADGKLWMIDWNPRFPAWIYGAAIAGTNLPARLVERSSGLPAHPVPIMSPEFTRVVLELPVREEFPLPAPTEPQTDALQPAFKYPSDMPSLMEQLRARPDVALGLPAEQFDEAAPAPAIPNVMSQDLTSIPLDGSETPQWLFLGATARSLFARAADLQRQFQATSIDVAFAYSIKTNPDERLLQLARDSGLLAETISQREIQRAVAAGFAPEQIVMNGPGKWWPHSTSHTSLYAVFCDSIDELRRVLTKEVKSIGSVLGIRVRPPQVKSRFGIPLDDYDIFQELICLVEQIPSEISLGIHMHMASSFIGVETWWDLVESVLEWSQAIEGASGRSVECLNLGGGWFPDDWEHSLSPRLSSVVTSAASALPDLRQVLLEPGKALAQPTMALAVRVLEVRATDDGVGEIVVDGSIAELPEIRNYPHRIATLDPTGQEWHALGRGSGRILGRLCMEDDILASQVAIPEYTQPGDIVVFCDAGAYDRSMSYVFGQG